MDKADKQIDRQIDIRRGNRDYVAAGYLADETSAETHRHTDRKTQTDRQTDR